MVDPDGVPFTYQSVDEIEAGEFMRDAVEAFRTGTPPNTAEPETALETEVETSFGEACPVCGMEISRTARQGKKFCSDRCRNRYHSSIRSKERSSMHEKVCEVCGRTFTAKKSNAKTCSSACRLRLYRDQQRLKAEAAVAKDVSLNPTLRDSTQEHASRARGGH
jgi:predicted nucleic acid-binding Zn ribbon protein